MPHQRPATTERPMRASLELDQLNDALEQALYRGWRVVVHKLGPAIVAVTVYDDQSAIVIMERGAQPAQTIRYAVQQALAKRQTQRY